MQLIDGKSLALEIQDELAEEVKKLLSDGKNAPHLAAVLVGADPASETYVRNKVKACERVGIISSMVRLGSDITQEKLIAEIKILNDNDDINGIIVQLPVPDHINVEQLTEAISYKKDVDGFHPVNVGRMAKNLPAFISATPYGILQLLERYKIETEGKHCVVLGRSDIVGMPMSILMARKSNPGNATVTLCHSKTHDLKEQLNQADILIAALGRPEFVTSDMVKEGAVVIDVGITRVKDDTTKSGFRLKGDVKFDEVAPKCSFITPVPGGVGPMTVTALLMNTLKSAKGEIY